MEKMTNANKGNKVNKLRVSEEKIRRKAFEIYQKTGNSNEFENWVEAKRELEKKLN
jgi:hypothetical protein